MNGRLSIIAVDILQRISDHCLIRSHGRWADRQTDPVDRHPKEIREKRMLVINPKGLPADNVAWRAFSVEQFCAGAKSNTKNHNGERYERDSGNERTISAESR